MKKYLAHLQELSLFSYLNPEDLHSLFSKSSLKKFSVDELIYSQNQRPVCFYLVLEGKVKLFKNHANGDETIFSILDPNAPFLDLCSLHKNEHTTHAQAIDDVVLLAIPFAIFKDAIKTNEKLNNNIMALLVSSYQENMRHCEQLSHHSTLQRVGWFLLRLFIQDQWQHRTLPLPFEKFLIANYLGMKPETFSRVLKKLKTHGVCINQQTVNLVDQSALCSYCTAEMAKECTLFKKTCLI